MSIYFNLHEFIYSYEVKNNEKLFKQLFFCAFALSSCNIGVVKYLY
jgi:hypothetical protein